MYGVSYNGCIGHRIVQAPFSRPSTRKYRKVRLNSIKLVVGESEPSLNNSFIHIVHSALDEKEKDKKQSKKK